LGKIGGVAETESRETGEEIVVARVVSVVTASFNGGKEMKTPLPPNSQQPPVQDD